MNAGKKTEKSFYRPVREWFQNTWHCENVEEDHCFDGLDLLTGDVVGTQASTKLRFACEMKDLPYPVGSQGYGRSGNRSFFRPTMFMSAMSRPTSRILPLGPGCVEN
jgi:hypothetical protein